jgi:hypothetical protein
VERCEQQALAIDERLRGELERKPTHALVEDLDRIEAAGDDRDQRRLETLRAALAEAERDAERSGTTPAHGAADRRALARLEAIREHAAERVAALRAEERAVRETVPPVTSGEREPVAAIERVLAERRRLRVDAAIRLEPAYLTEALGPRPDGLRRRLEWERAVDTLERHRQRLGVRDPDRALGDEPKASLERSRWRAARRELEGYRTRVVERDASNERTLTPVLGIER